MNEQAVHAEVYVPIFDAFGHCADCHLAQEALDALGKLVAAGKAVLLKTYPICGHALYYRSVAED